MITNDCIMELFYLAVYLTRSFDLQIDRYCLGEAKKLHQQCHGRMPNSETASVIKPTTTPWNTPNKRLYPANRCKSQTDCYPKTRRTTASCT